VPRLHTTAIAALAGSVLLVTAGAAYAHDRAQTKLVREPPPPPSMSWANYRGGLTDLLPQADAFDKAEATAMMMSVEGSSTFQLQIRGIDDGAAGKEYPVQLHEGPCVAGDGAAALGETEVRLDFEVNSQGTARTTTTVPFTPKPGERSIVIHRDGSNSTALRQAQRSPARLACLPLEIHLFPGPR
jgi:superoxide dismutase, Cu-Zn family